MIAMLIPIVLAITTAAPTFETDTIHTSAGDVTITFIGHASLLLTHQSKSIFIDPYGECAEYSNFPKADLIMVTHEHYDHLDSSSIEKIAKKETRIVTNGAGAQALHGATIMNIGNTLTVDGLKIEAVPAYNMKHTRDDGLPFHPKGQGNGYVLTIGETRIYFAGDTEGIPEMAQLKEIDIAFLPMNLPYTMTPDETAAAARSFMPKVLYPYHYGETDTKKIVSILKATPEIEVRIRRMK